MAQIIWAMTGQRPEGPQFYLVNANGFTNFRAAVDFAIRERVDFVLYSQVWAFGGDFDGSGYLNAEVDRAARAGIVWINAAGNFGGLAHEGRVTDLRESIPFENLVDDNQVGVTLSWTDNGPTPESYATRDLDLFVYRADGTLVASSQLVQRGEAPPATGESTLSGLARETVTLRGLDRGSYRISVRRKSDNFRAEDRYRILLLTERSETLRFDGRTAGAEIFPPADNRRAITVGEAGSTSSTGRTADGRVKPDLTIVDATVDFTDGQRARGSSTAAAIFTGVAAVLKSARPEIDAAWLLDYARALRTSEASGLLPVARSGLPASTQAILPADAAVLRHPNGHVIAVVDQDPLTLPQFVIGRAYRANPDDVLVLNPEIKSWHAVPRVLAAGILAPLVEFRQAFAWPAIWVTP
jgi:hypothetical protein